MRESNSSNTATVSEDHGTEMSNAAYNSVYLRYDAF